jgi:hypothetical protein
MTVTVAGGVATFSSALPGNLGVGDEVLAGASSYFCWRRLSPTEL